VQGNRLERVNSLIKQELGRVITTRLKDARLGFVTVTEADTSPDLKHCKVYISVLGSDKESQGTLAALSHSEGFLKREIARVLNLRFTPQLHFKLDTRAEHSLHMEDVFRKIREEREES